MFSQETMGPFDILYAPTSERHYFMGELHRGDDLPAVIIYNSKSEIIRQAWYKNGLKHRIIGPAVVEENKKEYWINGDQINIVKAK